MNPESPILGIIRSVLQVAGAYLVGKSIYGFDITADWLQTLLGVILCVGSLVWSIKSKCATIEMWQGAARQVTSFLLAFFGTWFAISDQETLAILGFVSSFIPTVYAYLSRRKTQNIVAGNTAYINTLKK